MSSFDIVLLVDDDPINNLINSRLLGKSGYSNDVLEFLEGEKALKHLELLSKSEKALIFLDINMPVLNGWEFLDRYEASFPDRNDRIIILSSSIDYQDKNRSKTYKKVCGFLEKPLSMSKIQIELPMLLS